MADDIDELYEIYFSDIIVAYFTDKIEFGNSFANNIYVISFFLF